MFFSNDDHSNYPGDQNIEEMLEDLALGEEESQVQNVKRDTTIFAIDCCKQMMIPLEDQTKSELQKILQSYSNFMMSKIIANTNDRVGLILYNINAKSNALNFDDIYTVQGLQPPSAQGIKKASSIEKEFIQKYGIAERTVPIHHLLWLYGNAIKDLDSSKHHLRLFIFTTNDCPHEVGDSRREQAINHARQLASKSVQIQLFPIREKKKFTFDIRKFYQEIITFDVQELNETVIDSSSKILDLQSRLRQKQFKKRTLNRLLLKVGNDTEVGVKIFSLYNKAKKPLGKKVEAETNKPLKRVVKKLNNKGEVLFDTQIGTYYPLGGEKIKLNKQDVNKMKNLESLGMTLIGFKPKHLIKPYHNLRTSYFLYSDQEHVSGSSQFLDALIDELTETNMVGIAKIMPRKNTQMRFAALFPQKQSYDDEDHYQTPPGLNIIILPFADDIVNHVGDKTISKPQPISSQLVQVTKLLINNLTVNEFDFRNFQNPSLQKFYSHLQAHALNEPQVEERADYLMPDQNGFQKIKDVVDLLKQTALEDLKCRIKCQGDMEDEDSENDCATRGKTKREVKVKIEEQQKKSKVKGKETKKQKEKEIKIEDDEENDEMREIESLVVQGQFGQVKVPQLKKYLKSKGLDDKGKKQDLLDRIMVYISHKNSI